METARILKPDDVDRMLGQIEQAVHDRFDKLEKLVVENVVEKPLTRQEAAQHCKCSATTLSALITSGDIPSEYVHKFGGQPRFFASELNEAIRKSKRLKRLQQRES